MTIRVALMALLVAGCTAPGLVPGSVPASGTPSDTATTSVRPTSAEPSASPGVSADASTTPPPMPAGFPVHESMEPIDPERGYIAAWESDAVPSRVYAFYMEELPAAGFVVDLAAPGGGAAIIRFTAPDGTAYQLDMTGRIPHEIALGSPHP